MLNIKLSTAQTVALHVVESVLISAVITVLTALVQYVGKNGLNLPQLGIEAGALFLGAMAMVYKSLSTNPQVIAGLNDTIPQIWQSVQNIEQALIPGVAPRLNSTSTKAAPSQWKATVSGPTINTTEHSG